MKSFHSNPSFQEKALKSVKTKIIKRQPTIISTTCTTTTPSPTHTNSFDSQSTTSKGPLSYCFDIPQNSLTLSTTPYELDGYMLSNVPFSGHDDVL
ncbi:unnamed protein product [Rotaria sordida]|uniref:Uncharacterized protein n=1 Tax=Rotaria sordida TaxID=392033 RepID=A0A819PWR3_9BILA|nr:unnamed protein product [Rotaria sordida]CAF1008034.1 unnamed protein product [Rotaria sordida]CAF1108994.1 unnamed protein product [Rotaria sordida]CAF1136341.1 unnamed protein product [Rotaria sordida]CAF1149521.1 unnamed protein product [Rotaria sordida]